MNVFLPIFFNAPLGGLQNHCLAIARSLVSNSHRCTVLCKDGPFASSARDVGADVVTTDFASVADDVEKVTRHAKFDLVHAQPFKSREVGLEVAKRQGIPFALTFHGMYHDDLRSYASSVGLVITVCDAIRDFIVNNKIISPDKVITIPNGVDTSLYTASANDTLSINTDPQKKVVSIVSRYDVDKQFLVNVVIETLKLSADLRNAVVQIAGSGTLLDSICAIAQNVNTRCGEERVKFLGWKSSIDLVSVYRESSVVVASGRGALESMAMGKPTIAIGSKGCLGVLDEQNLPAAMYGNFGGFGRGDASYQQGRLFEDLKRILDDSAFAHRVGRLGLHVAATFFDQHHIDERLLTLYSMLADSKP